MRVAMYYRNSDIRLEEVPRPKAEAGEILVKVQASGICGSDVMEWYRIKRAPLVLGHEIAGDIVEVGDGVEEWKIGDRVVVTHHVPDNSCKYCRSGHHSVCDTLRKTNFFPGGFSEFVRVPKINVETGTLKMPDEMTYDQGTFVEPLGCVVRGMRLANLSWGQSVLVLGAGIAGVLNIKMAKALNAGEIIATDANPERLKRAKEFGANHVIDAKEDVPANVRKITDSNGADLVIVCTGALTAFDQAIRSVDRGGTEEHVSLPVNELWRNEVKLMTSYAAAPSDLRQAMALIASKKVEVDDMITHRLPLAETQKGFQLVAAGGNSLKVVIEPQK
jgi:L-iditol 2-dehydrogenase